MEVNNYSTNTKAILFSTRFTLESEPPSYPLQIVAIPDRTIQAPEFIRGTRPYGVERSRRRTSRPWTPYKERVNRDRNCQLVHGDSGLKVPGQFTDDEAQEILETTRYWDFTLDKERVPRCRERLRLLLEQICARPSDSREVSA